MGTGYSGNYTNTKVAIHQFQRLVMSGIAIKRLLIICLTLIIPKVVRRLSL